VPVIVAAIIAAVASPVMDRLQRWGLPRAAGAALVFLALIALGVGVAVMILNGITNEAQSIGGQLQRATERIAEWLQDAGVDASTAEAAREDVSGSVSSAFDALLTGITAGIDKLAGLAVFLSFTALALFFLLKDGPLIAHFVRRHMGVPAPVADAITGRTAGSLQGYFLGMTIVSLFSATVVGLGALALDVAVPGTLFAVTFVGGYVPYLGAWTAGIFAVLIALGSQGADAAAAMAVIALLANGALQQLVQPIAYGTALDLHPLAVLIVTIAGGALFGAIGLILAAPLTSAAVHISADLARARARAEQQEPPETSEVAPASA
jgi:predicted PurR-regulated permease PerM